MILSLSDNVSSKNIDLILHRQSSIFKSVYTRYNLLAPVSIARFLGPLAFLGNGRFREPSICGQVAK